MFTMSELWLAPISHAIRIFAVSPPPKKSTQAGIITNTQSAIKITSLITRMRLNPRNFQLTDKMYDNNAMPKSLISTILLTSQCVTGVK